MTLDEYQAKLKKTLDDLRQEHGQIMFSLAVNALSVIKTRVQGQGVDANGQPFTPYSTKPTLAGRRSFLNKKGFNAVAGSKSKRKALQWRTVKGRRLFILPGGYKEIRRLSGLQTQHKDFTFTGELWRSMAVRLRGKSTAVISPRTEGKKKILGYLQDKYIILDLTEQERKNLIADYDRAVMSIFRRNGL